ncbi:MAG: hypothetical protein GX616_03645, partial [Planctomycetes bacterium]|nr:hypothetical protein [Planctomycetota bacterium]
QEQMKNLDMKEINAVRTASCRLEMARCYEEFYNQYGFDPPVPWPDDKRLYESYRSDYLKADEDFTRSLRHEFWLAQAHEKVVEAERQLNEAIAKSTAGQEKTTAAVEAGKSLFLAGKSTKMPLPHLSDRIEPDRFCLAYLKQRPLAPQKSAGSIAGLVLDEKGQPAKDAQVFISPTRPTSGEQRIVPANEQGVFASGPLDTGTYFVSAFRHSTPQTKDWKGKPGYLLGSAREVKVGASGKSEVTLRAGTETGIAAPDGKHADSATLDVMLAKPSSHHLEWGIVFVALSSPQWPVEQDERAARRPFPPDQLGFFFVEPGKPFTIHNVPPGKLYLRATPSDPGSLDASEAKAVDIKAGQRHSIGLGLQPSAPKAPAVAAPAVWSSRPVVKDAAEEAFALLAADRPDEWQIVATSRGPLYQGRLITWDQLEILIAATPEPRPKTMYVASTLEVKRDELEERIAGLRRRLGIDRVTRSSMSPRSSRLWEERAASPASRPANAGRVARTILTPKGLLAEGAQVIVCEGSESFDLHVENGRLRNPLDESFVTTDTYGRFVASASKPSPDLIILHQTGFAWVRGGGLAAAAKRLLDGGENGPLASLPMRLEAWGIVKGTLRIGRHQAAGETISIVAALPHAADSKRPRISLIQHTQTRADGSYEFTGIPPFPATLHHHVRTDDGMLLSSQGTRIEVRPGQVLTQDIGGQGRPVIGRIEVPEALAEQMQKNRQPTGWIRPYLKVPYPPDLDRSDTAKADAWYEQWRQTAAGKAQLEAWQKDVRSSAVVVKPDGRFRAEDVPAGSYSLIIEIPGATPGAGHATKIFDVPEIPGGRSDEPLDLGTIQAVAIENPGESEKKELAQALRDDDFQIRKAAAEKLSKLQWTPADTSEQVRYLIATGKFTEASKLTPAIQIAPNKSRAEGPITFDVPLMVDLETGPRGRTQVRWIEFPRTDDHFRIVLNCWYPSEPKAAWTLRVTLLTEKGNLRNCIERTFESKGSTSGDWVLEYEPIKFDLGKRNDLIAAARFVVELAPAAVHPPPVLAGRITDLGGRPIEGVKVRVDTGLATWFPLAELTTNSAGEYRLELRQGATLFDKATGRHDFSLGVRPEHPDWLLPEGKSGALIVPNVSGQVTTRDFRMAPASTGRATSGPAMSRSRLLPRNPSSRPAEEGGIGGPAGTVLAPDGKPAGNATVVLVRPSQAGRAYAARFLDGRVDDARTGAVATTGSDGRFSFLSQTQPFRVVILHDQGFGELTMEAAAGSPQIKLQPWGRVEGRLQIGNKPGSKEKIILRSEYQDPRNPDLRICHEYTDQSDDDGRFVLGRVAPRPGFVGREVQYIKEKSCMIFFDHAVPVEVTPGETTKVTVGGSGRTVTGRLAVPPGKSVDFDRAFVSGSLSIRRPLPTFPANASNMTDSQKIEWYESWLASAEGQVWRKAEMIHYYVPVTSDGTFRVQDVPPGKYDLHISAHELHIGDAWGMGEQIGGAASELTVPDGAGDSTVDVGSLELKSPPRRG